MQNVRVMNSQHKMNMNMMSRIAAVEHEMDQLNQQQSFIEDQISQLRAKVKRGQKPTHKQNERMRSLLTSRKALKDAYTSKEKHARELRQLQRKTDSVYAAHDLREAKELVTKELKNMNLIGDSAIRRWEEAQDRDDETQDIVDAVTVQLDSTVYDDEVDDGDLAAAWASDSEEDTTRRAVTTVGRHVTGIGDVFSDGTETTRTYDMRPPKEMAEDPLGREDLDTRTYVEEKYGLTLT